MNILYNNIHIMYGKIFNTPFYLKFNIMSMIWKYNKETYYMLQNMYPIMNNNNEFITVDELYSICKICGNSFNNIIMGTIKKNVKFAYNPEELLVIDDVVLNKDVGYIIMNYVYESEKEDEKDIICNPKYFLISSQFHVEIYDHSLITLFELINYVRFKCRSILKSKDSHCSEYGMKVFNKHESHESQIYIEYGYSLKHHTLIYLKKMYDNYERTIVNNEYVVFSLENTLPDVYLQSVIKYTSGSITITVI